jgi:hypothetical protein
MGKLTVAAVTATMISLVALGMPAVAAPVVPSASAPVSKMPWLQATEQERLMALEEGCIKDGDLACTMSDAAVHKLPADIEKDSDDLHNLVVNNKDVKAAVLALRSAAIAPQDMNARVAGIANVLQKITKVSSNPAIRKLSDKVDEFADIAGKASAGGGALTTNTIMGYAEAAIGLVPVLGDIYSLGSAIANGDVETGVCAAISLVGTAIGLAFPPAGAVIAAGLAIYSLGKLIWSFFEAKPRDWIKQPPADPQELFESGADIKWDARKINGREANLVFPEDGRTATQTLLLDSKWTTYNKDRQPVKYTIKGVSSVGLLNQQDWNMLLELPVLMGPPPTMTAWQDGKKYTGACEIVAHGGVVCGLIKQSIVISANHPAMIRITTTLDDYIQSICGTPPCTREGEQFGYLGVHSEGSEFVGLMIPYVLGMV